MEKKCKKCGEVKLLDEFVKCSRNTSGHGSICLECKRKQYEENKDKILKQQKEYYDNNKEEINKKNRLYYENNKEKIQEGNERYKQEHLEQIREYQKQYKKENREKLNEYEKERLKNNPESMKQKIEYCKKYYQDNKEWYDEWHKNHREKEETKEYKRNYIKEKCKNDISFRINHNISSLLRQSLKDIGLSKDGNSYFKLVNYTKEQLIEHLERQFVDGMSWDNYGKSTKEKRKWNIDHIEPRSIFNIKQIGDEEFLKCWDLNNLQPLWEDENLKKSNKIII